jgi:hypothetical protein
MDPDQCAELSRRLEVMERVGEAPGLAEDSFSSPLSLSIAEMQAAVHDDVESMNTEDCLRALVKQNNVLIRDAICRRHGVASAASSSEQISGSLRSSLTTTGSASARSSPNSGSSDSPVRKRQSPPKLFVCPVCQKPLNEKDFDRHVFAWVSKVDKVGVVRSDTCAGIRDDRDPLLQRYPFGTLAQRVSCVVTYIRSLLHPGAYDAMSAEGSGRHLIINQAISWLLGQD